MGAAATRAGGRAGGSARGRTGGRSAARGRTGVLVARHVTFGWDSLWYHLVGSEINEGHGHVNPAVYYPTHQSVATAQFPPLYPTFLAALDRVGLHSPFSHQLAGAVVGVVTVPLVALLARRVLGPVLALAAAAVLAVEPTLAAGDSAAMSETRAVC